MEEVAAGDLAHPFSLSDVPSLLSVVCFDAKINFDDNAKFRQRDIFLLEDHAESDPREVEATQHNLNYIGMDGSIGCLGRNTHCRL